MSVEDELELKDLLVQTLTNNGCLAKIKAQLRASVFLSLEEDIKLSSQKPLLNEKLKSCLDTSEGQLMFCIVKEFLEYFNLQSTMAVFDAESYLGVSYQYNGRLKTSEDLGFTEENGTVPLLQQVINIAQQKPKTLKVNLNVDENSEVTDNNYSNSEKIIKTDSNINEDFSYSNGSSSSNGKVNGINNMNEENLVNSKSTYENGNYSVNLNETFITEPTIILKNTGGHIGNKINQTFDVHTSSEEIPVNSNIHIPLLPTVLSEKIEEVTPPILKELKISPERVKSPPKSEKFKSKNSLSSFSDLPPLNMNKNRSGTILPSLYTKEFREKPNS